ncbi:MAG: AmmeMemoRadiSam system protein B [Firmicutes bacterium]|nr:AmmeMemoRadiSam system protein B [Bacillota bacterium]
MQKYKCAFLGLLIFLCACAVTEEPEPESITRVPYNKIVKTDCFVRENELDAPNPVILPPGTKAVIVPHGGESIRMAAEVIAGLAALNPKTVILVGPNHTKNGPKITTTYAAFSAYDGIVLPREDLIRVLEGRGLAGTEDALFVTEHSVGILMPLLARYLPGAKAVPVIFQKGVTFGAAKLAIDTLCELAGPDTVVVASIDFSHGLPSREEQHRRASMRECIRIYDAAGVLNLDATYVDAPVLLGTLLQRMKDSGCAVEFIESANSTELLGREVPAATGYMTIAFCGE